jgi:hypothetical protein
MCRVYHIHSLAVYILSATAGITGPALAMNNDESHGIGEGRIYYGVVVTDELITDDVSLHPVLVQPAEQPTAGYTRSSHTAPPPYTLLATDEG